MEKMSKEQLEEFVGAELQQIGKDIFSTIDGKFTVKHVNFVEVEGVPDPDSWFNGDVPFRPGYFCDVVRKPFTNSENARTWLQKSFELYPLVEKWYANAGKQPREHTVVRRRLERARSLAG